MQHKQRDVIFLKPAPAFLSFLKTHLPHSPMPSLRALQTDTTAYSLPQHDNNDDALLDTIESHFESMFRHEISRWLGIDATRDLKASFLDFLCCFKFEFHTHLVLLESSCEANQMVLRLKPRPNLLRWMQSSHIEEDGDETVLVLEQVKLSHLTENATVVIKSFQHRDDVQPFMKHYFRPIFKTEMMRLCESREQWPPVQSFDDFNRYFSVDVHSTLIHLD
jgi:hypothetical protein